MFSGTLLKRPVILSRIPGSIDHRQEHSCGDGSFESHQARQRRPRKTRQLFFPFENSRRRPLSLRDYRNDRRRPEISPRRSFFESLSNGPRSRRKFFRFLRLARRLARPKIPHNEKTCYLRLTSRVDRCGSHSRFDRTHRKRSARCQPFRAAPRLARIRRRARKQSLFNPCANQSRKRQAPLRRLDF